MEMELNGNKQNLHLSVEEALDLIQKLTKSVSGSLKHNSSSFSAAAPMSVVPGKYFPGVLNVTVTV